MELVLKQDSFKSIIKDICIELNIKYTFLSKNWVIMLEKNGVTRFICGYKFDLVRHGFGMLLDDKYAMYDVLKSRNIPIIEHNIIYSSKNLESYAIGCNSYVYLFNLFNKYNNSIVLKTNNGSCGLGVYYINSLDDLKNKYDKLISKNHSLSICPFYDIINEFRVIVLDGEIKLVYKKIRPVVVGDGIKTIKELLVLFNKDYFTNYNDSNKDIVLGKGEEYSYDWKFNLSRGSISSLEIDDDSMAIIKDIINKINSTIDVRFGSVDIIRTKDNKYLVMEINSGVMMENFIKQNKDGKRIAKDIYKEAVEKMFE